MPNPIVCKESPEIKFLVLNLRQRLKRTKYQLSYPIVCKKMSKICTFVTICLVNEGTWQRNYL